MTPAEAALAVTLGWTFILFLAVSRAMIVEKVDQLLPAVLSYREWRKNPDPAPLVAMYDVLRHQGHTPGPPI